MLSIVEVSAGPVRKEAVSPNARSDAGVAAAVGAGGLVSVGAAAAAGISGAGAGAGVLATGAGAGAGVGLGYVGPVSAGSEVGGKLGVYL